MNAVVCNNYQCKYNGGKFCNKPILIMRNGGCSELIDKNGNPRDPSVWTKQVMSADEWKKRYEST